MRVEANAFIHFALIHFALIHFALVRFALIHFDLVHFALIHFALIHFALIHFVPGFRRFIAVKMDATQLCLAAFVLGSLLTVGSCGNYTVTDEAWFEVEIKDFEGSGLHYKGIFTIALFGESAPMTVMNFAAIVRGYKRGKVSQCLYIGYLCYTLIIGLQPVPWGLAAFPRALVTESLQRCKNASILYGPTGIF